MTIKVTLLNFPIYIPQEGLWNQSISLNSCTHPLKTPRCKQGVSIGKGVNDVHVLDDS